MAKKPTNPTKLAASRAAAKPASPTANGNGASAGALPPAPEPATPKTATAPAGKGKPKAKPPAGEAVKPAAATPDEVALRAYFLAEKRRDLGLPGDEHTDWIEAERQLKAESKRGGKAKSG